MLQSDLKHVLENVNHGNDKTLKNPVIISDTESIIKIFKKGLSWKVETNLGKIFTVANLHFMVQVYLYSNVLCEHDTRVEPRKTSVEKYINL